MTDGFNTPAYSWTQGLAGMMGQPGAGAGAASPSTGSNPAAGANIVAALIRKMRGDTPDMSSYEGGVASPANPFNSGTFGMPGGPPPQAQGSPPPFTGQPPPQAQGSPFTQGAAPTPFLGQPNPMMGALFSQPPAA